MNDRPVRLTVSDDMQRSRITVLVRLLLVIPHFLWVLVFSIPAFFATIANWFVTLARGRSPLAIHVFLASYIRYLTHVYAYLSLAANPYPRFLGQKSYPVDVEIDAPARQRRL